MKDSDMLTEAFERFDTANAEDPNSLHINGVRQPKELVFAKRLSEAVLALEPHASVPLRLASRCQHICRWKIPRNTEPLGRAGYLKWRTGLKKFHAETSAKILREVGYDDKTIAQVKSLNEKKNIKTDADCQTLEDALCLVFLQYQFDGLISNMEQEKMLQIVQKTLAKMSDRGRAAAQKLSYSETAAELLKKACIDSS